MRIRLSILLFAAFGLLLSSSAKAVTLADFSCADGGSALCSSGEDNLSAKLKQGRRTGRAHLLLTLSDTGAGVIDDILVTSLTTAGGSEIVSIRRTRKEGRYRVEYRGDFDQLVEHIQVGVDVLSRHGRRARLVSGAVPEPSAAMLFGFGAMVVALRLRSR